MNKGRRSLSVLALALFLGGVGAAEAQRSANVTGRIVDEEGNPLLDAKVTVYSEEESRVDETNKKGRFRLVIMDATQPLRIRVEKQGYTTIEEPVSVQIGATLAKVWEMTAAPDAPVAVSGNSEAIEAYNAGATAYNAGEYEAARESFETALGLAPELLEARKVVTLVYFHLQDWQAAAESAGLLADAEPDNDAALKIGFDSSSQLGDLEGAARFLDLLVALPPKPDIATRVFNQGVGELRAGNREVAVERFQQAIEIDPALAVAYGGLSSIHLEDENYDAALAAADRLLEIDPGNAEGLGIRYEAYRRMGDEEKMAAALDELQSADPDRIVDAYYKQGMLLFNEGNAQGAVEAFERVLSADPTHARAHYQLGRACLSAGDYDRGKELLEKFIEMAPDDPEVESAKSMLSYLD